MFSSIDVHNRLQDLEVPHELFKLAGQAQSIDRAAAALGLEPSEIARVELYSVDGRYVVVVFPGDREVDPDKLAQVTGGGEVSRVPDGDVPSLTGFRAGTLPPIAHKQDLPTYIDYYTLKEDVVYTGSGEPTAILKIRSYDLVRATSGETVDIVAEAGPG